jgi:hypothetical protein
VRGTVRPCALSERPFTEADVWTEPHPNIVRVARDSPTNEAAFFLPSDGAIESLNSAVPIINRNYFWLSASL